MSTSNTAAKTHEVGTMSSLEAVEEMSRRGTPCSSDQLWRCTQALFPRGDVRRGRTRGRRYRDEHLNLVSAGLDLIGATGMTYELLTILQRFAIENGQETIDVFERLINIAKTGGWNYSGRPDVSSWRSA